MLLSKKISRSVKSIALGIVVTLCVFGLLLALVWAVIPQSPAWKLVGALAAGSLGLFAGGFVLSWSSRADSWVFPAVFGLVFGGVSFTYILGLDGVVLLLAGACALAALLGGHLYRALLT